MDSKLLAHLCCFLFGCFPGSRGGAWGWWDYLWKGEERCRLILFANVGKVLCGMNVL
jgi:hypothetical protein